MVPSNAGNKKLHVRRSFLQQLFYLLCAVGLPIPTQFEGGDEILSIGLIVPDAIAEPSTRDFLIDGI